jgi:hypothetical protein
MESVGQALLPIVYGAIAVESVVNIVRNIQAKQTNWQYWAALGLSLILGVVVALTYSLDFFSLIGLEERIPFVGAVITGLIISRGANIVSDLVGLVNRGGRG